MATSQDFVNWVCSEALDPRFLMYALLAEGDHILEFGRGSTHTTIYFPEVMAFHICLPPLAEQRRIVEKVEALFARTSHARKNLLSVKSSLARFRAALLSAAVSGQLTTEWASVSLSEEERAWSSYILGDMFAVATGATPLRKNRAYYERGTVPWIKSGAVNDGEITAAEEFITPLALRETNAKIFPTGTLLVAMYGEGATRGKVAELKIEAATNQALAVILFDESSELLRGFLKLIFQARYHSMRAESAGGVQPNLSLEMIRAMELRIPSPRERQEIGRRVTSVMALLHKIEARVESALSRATRLSQTILAKAFAGELVPTEAELARREGRSYEPATVLLDRIPAERGRAKAAPQRRRRSMATSASRGARSRQR